MKVDFRELFPHVYETMDRDFFGDYSGWEIESIEYKFTAWKHEHYLGMVLRREGRKVRISQYRSPHYAGGFSHVIVEEVHPAEEAGAQEWTVWRHGGRSGDEWRCVARGSEAECREQYRRLFVAMRQGGVELRDPSGEVVDRAWAPRLRTRW